MMIYQKDLADQLELPVFFSSLLQISFMRQLIPDNAKIGIITANSEALDSDVLRLCCSDFSDKLAIQGLENYPIFADAYLKETSGEIEFEAVQEEVVAAARKLVDKEPAVKMLLLECSVLSPYGDAVQRITGLPVFDYITMINYVYAAVVKQKFTGYM